MSSVDSIWADMKTESNVALKPKTTKIGFVSEHACKSSKKEKKEKKVNKEKKVTKSEILAGLHTKSHTPSDSDDTAIATMKDGDIPELKMSGDELVMRLQRPIQQTKDENLTVRRAALETIHELVCVRLKDKLSDHTMVYDYSLFMCCISQTFNQEVFFLITTASLLLYVHSLLLVCRRCCWTSCLRPC